MTTNADAPALEEREARLAEDPVREADVPAELGHRLDAALGVQRYRLQNPLRSPLNHSDPSGAQAAWQIDSRARRRRRRPCGWHRRSRRAGSRPTACRGGPTPATTTPPRRGASAASATKSGPATTTSGSPGSSAASRTIVLTASRARAAWCLLDAQDRRCRPARRRRRRSAGRGELGLGGQGDRLRVARRRAGAGAASAQSANHSTPSRTHHAPPPYSCTAVRAFQGAARPRRPRRRARRRSTALRPPSSGRLSDHHTSSPSNATAPGARRRPHHQLARDRCRPGSVGEPDRRRHGADGDGVDGAGGSHDRAVVRARGARCRRAARRAVPTTPCRSDDAGQREHTGPTPSTSARIAHRQHGALVVGDAAAMRDVRPVRSPGSCALALDDAVRRGAHLLQQPSSSPARDRPARVRRRRAAVSRRPTLTTRGRSRCHHARRRWWRGRCPRRSRAGRRAGGGRRDVSSTVPLPITRSWGEPVSSWAVYVDDVDRVGDEQHDGVRRRRRGSAAGHGGRARRAPARSSLLWPRACLAPAVTMTRSASAAHGDVAAARRRARRRRTEAVTEVERFRFGPHPVDVVQRDLRRRRRLDQCWRRRPRPRRCRAPTHRDLPETRHRRHRTPCRTLAAFVQVTGIDHVVFNVSDAERAVTFWRDLLGPRAGAPRGVAPGRGAVRLGAHLGRHDPRPVRDAAHR